MALTQAQLADIERAKAMVAQSQAEGSKPFKGSSFDKPDAPWNQATPNISGGLETKPIDNTGGGNLTAFKDTLGQVMNLARQARNSNMQGFMNTPGFQGTLAASDFNTLFNQMNTMGDQYGEMQAEKIVGETTPQWKTDQIGSDVYQYQIGPDGKMIGEPVKVLSGEGSRDDELLAGIKKRLGNDDISGLQAAGLTLPEIGNLLKNIDNIGFDETLNKATDLSDAEKNAIKKVWGKSVEPTREEITKDMKLIFSDKELKEIADDLGYSSMFDKAETDIENMFKNATIDELIRAISNNAK